MAETYRIVVAKPGLDRHDRGARSSPARCAARVSNDLHGAAPDARADLETILEDADAVIFPTTRARI
jgi:methylmalonyl-CoA mutase cobalamin-binding subunit